jgi:hypothetical protein
VVGLDNIANEMQLKKRIQNFSGVINDSAENLNLAIHFGSERGKEKRMGKLS